MNNLIHELNVHFGEPEGADLEHRPIAIPSYIGPLRTIASGSRGVLLCRQWALALVRCHIQSSEP